MVMQLCHNCSINCGIIFCVYWLKNFVIPLTLFFLYVVFKNMDTFVGYAPVTFSDNEINVLNKAFSDKNFCKQFEDFSKEISDPKNLNHYESELKKLGKERGYDITLLEASPGLAFLATTVEKSEKVCVNISVSDKIEKPSFSYVESFDCVKWNVPHAVLKPRVEFDLGEIFYGSENVKINDEIKQEYKVAAKMDGVLVYEIIVNQICIDFAKYTESIREHLISIARESIKNKMKIHLKDEKFFGFHVYFGKSTISQMKSITNCELFYQNKDSVTISDLNKENSENESINCFNKGTLNEKEKNNNITTPSFRLKHVDHVTLQDYSIIRNENPSSLKCQSLLLEVNLPGIKSSSDIDVDIVKNKNLHLTTSKEIKYNLDLQLPFKIEEKPVNAKFNIETSILEIELKVKRHCTHITFDSGIESDNTYRTSSDNDNSSVSSNEENDLKAIVSCDKNLNLQCNQVDQFLYISMNCEKINIESVKLNNVDSYSFLYSYEDVKKECNIMYISVDPESYSDNGIKYYVLNQVIWIQVEKSKPKIWSKLKVQSYNSDDVRDILENKENMKNITKKTPAKSCILDINCDPALIPVMSDLENKENTICASENIPDNILCSSVSHKDGDFFRKPLFPSCNFSQSQNYLILNIHCKTSDIKDILIGSINTKMFHFQYKLIGKGYAPLFYGGYVCTSPYTFKPNTISHKVLDDSLSIVIEKKKLSLWQKVRIGKEPRTWKEMKIKNILMAEDNTAVEEKQVDKLRKNGPKVDDEIPKMDSVPDCSDECSKEPLIGKESFYRQVKLGVCRKSSEIDIPKSVRKTTDCFVTSSWPKGILKSRSRSLSDSHIHSHLDVFGSNGFCTSVECYDDDEMSEENELSSSPKKSVRFNEFVSKQVFRIDSSIIGQKSKNQKKAQQRKRARDRKLLSELNQSSGTDTVTEHSDATSTEDDSNTDAERNVKSSKKGNGSRRTNRDKVNCRRKKEKLNKKNRRNTKPALSLCNEMIFQLDD